MRAEKSESGFSYIDVMIAITILLVGIVALLSAITAGVASTTSIQNNTEARQVLTSSMESIVSARDISTLGFSSIANVGDPIMQGGVFLTGFQPIYPSSGKDGVIGTLDDAYGLDGKPGTPDDVAAIPGFQRQIVVQNIPDVGRPGVLGLSRQVTVSIRYTGAHGAQIESMATYISNYRTSADGN